jgi:hypothetical protein
MQPTDADESTGNQPANASIDFNILKVDLMQEKDEYISKSLGL